MALERGDPSRWLIFLGAGASAASPSRLPAFPALATGVLRAIGWQPTAGGRGWAHRRYPDIDTEGMAPEVLFGALSRFGVTFAPQVAAALDTGLPNAVHHAAAAVLAEGGCVWTTNIDRLIEAACVAAPHRAGVTARQGVLASLGDAGPGTLVKFHGSAEAPQTLAFTDRELLAPPPAADVEHLAHLADGRIVVVYGYAGADADLHGVLDATFARAAEVLWLEPGGRARQSISRAFPQARVRFLPEIVPPRFEHAIASTGRAFVDLARDAGIALDEQLAMALQQAEWVPPPPTIRIARPPAIAHARLVERFGAPGADRIALSAARREDMRAFRVDALSGHLRWTLNLSLYGGGLAARAVDGLVKRRSALARLRPAAVRDYVITGGHALRLQQRDWLAVDDLASWAVDHRPGGGQPTDYYYRAHARRYAMRISEAVADADAAAEGLSATADPERHAGAVLEQGCLAICQGRFDRALRAAFELRYRTGRYAIPRWQAWGAWLEAVALCHAGRPADARETIHAAEPRFNGEGLPGPIADLRTATLLAARVELAIGGDGGLEPSVDELSDAESLGGRYLDDRCLVLADLALGRQDFDSAQALLHRVAGRPSCPLAETWAALGLAELRRLGGDATGAAHDFQRLARLAAGRCAWWLQAQAAIGMDACGVVGDKWDGVPSDVRQVAETHRTLGSPRILWMTV